MYEVDFQDWEQPPSDKVEVTEDSSHFEAEGDIDSRMEQMAEVETCLILALIFGQQTLEAGVMPWGLYHQVCTDFLCTFENT